MVKKKRLRVVADENIPWVSELFAELGEVRLLPGRHIQRADVVDADVLLVRSVTPVNAQLLEGTRVKFVGTATTGTEHVAIEWLLDNQISFASAAGCNAEAVAEYVVCVIAALRKQGKLRANACQAGIIGVGRVGTRVAEKLKILGFNVVCNDPPRADHEPHFVSTPLAAFAELDLICVHTPLTVEGDYPTHHLLSHDFFRKLRSGCVLLNAGRGAVINSLDFERYARSIQACFDVWENEPEINLKVLAQAALATPHIAGYTREAKLRGTRMLYEAVLKWLNFPLPALDEAKHLLPYTALANVNSWENAVLQVYDPVEDTQQMQQLLCQPATVAAGFDELRKHHQRRIEFSSVFLRDKNQLIEKDLQILKALGMNIS